MNGDTTLKAVLLGEDRSMSRTFRGAGDEAERTRGRLGGLGKAFSGMAGPAAIGIAAVAGVGAVAVTAGRAVVTAASDQNETLNKSSVIFGKNAAAIEKWGSSAWKNLGLSKNQAIGAAAGFGDMFMQLGFTQRKATDMSKSVVQMSADLGSFHNLPTAEVAEMVSAAFRGEYDSLQRLIPNINAARVEQEALATTGKKSAKELTAAEKAAATLAIVQRDGARAAGDFARTSGGVANQQKIIAARFEDTKAAIGQRLLPMLTRLGGWFIEDGLPAIERFGGWITGSLWPALKSGYQTVLPGIRSALSILSGGVGDGEMSWRKFGEVITGKVIPFISLVARHYLPMWATQIRSVIEVVKACWRTFEVWRDVVTRVASFILRRFADVTSTGAAMLRALSKVPGFGWARDAADKLDRAAGKARALAAGVRTIPSSKTVDLYVRTRQTGRIRLPNGTTVNMGLRAGGGPMIAGGEYLVGENGPEIVSPGETSHVTPARQTAATLAARSAAAGARAASAGGDGRQLVAQLLLDGRVIHESLLRLRNGRGTGLGLA